MAAAYWSTRFRDPAGKTSHTSQLMESRESCHEGQRRSLAEAHQNDFRLLYGAVAYFGKDDILQVRHRGGRTCVVVVMHAWREMRNIKPARSDSTLAAGYRSFHAEKQVKHM